MCPSSSNQKNLIGVVTIIYEESWIDEARDEAAVVDLLGKVINAEQCLDAIAFPAGTLVVGPNDDPHECANRIVAKLPKRRSIIVYGVDVRGSEGSLLDHRPRKGKGMQRGWDANRYPVLSCFAYAAAPDGSKLIWGARQLGYRSTQAISYSKMPNIRSIRFGTVEVGLLICGEIMAKVYGRGRPFDRVRHIADQADVVVDIAHADVALRSLVRWTTAIEDVASSGSGGRSVLVAQHLATDFIKRALRKYTDEGEVPKLASTASRHVRRTVVGEVEPGIPEAVIDVYQVG